MRFPNHPMGLWLLLATVMMWRCQSNAPSTPPSEIKASGVDQSPAPIQQQTGLGLGSSYRKVYDHTKQRLKQQSIRTVLRDIVARRQEDKELAP